MAKPLRLALGSLIFIDLPGYQTQAPFDASTLVWFCKRITIDILNEVDEYMLEYKDDDGPVPPVPGGTNGDATGAVICAEISCITSNSVRNGLVKCKNKYEY